MAEPFRDIQRSTPWASAARVMASERYRQKSITHGWSMRENNFQYVFVRYNLHCKLGHMQIVSYGDKMSGESTALTVIMSHPIQRFWLV